MSDHHEKKMNLMGSEVVPGYRCKPVKKDPERPIMYFRHHLFLCTGQRCREAAGDRNLAEEFRGELEDLGLHRGSHRIKVTSGNCFGACRFRSVAAIYENSSTSTNSCVWIRRIHKLDSNQRQKLFVSLRDDLPLEDSESGFASYLIPMEEPGENP